MDDEYVKKLVVARLRSVPPDISYSVGEYGDFTRNQLIEQVEQGTAVGKAATEMELNFIKKMPKLSQMVGCQNYM